jgi:hypothetical protein
MQVFGYVVEIKMVQIQEEREDESENFVSGPTCKFNDCWNAHSGGCWCLVALWKSEWYTDSKIRKSVAD